MRTSDGLTEGETLDDDGSIGIPTRDTVVEDGDQGLAAQPGTVLAGTYVIEARLGAGGMGQVYQASDLVLGRRVAIKLLQPSQRRRLEGDARARREGRLLSRLNHPNVIGVHTFGVSDGLCFLVMELVDGGDLGRRMRGRPQLPVGEAWHIVHQTAAALGHAHAHGLVHRDVKPENILLASFEGDPLFVKVADFGLARELVPLSDDGVRTAAGLVGTPRYMAPEQALAKEVDQRCDIYSLAVLCYELFVGAHPFGNRALLDMCVAHVNEPVPLPSSRLSGPLGAALDGVLLRALAKEPSARHADTESFIADLARALGTVGPVACCAAGRLGPEPSLPAAPPPAPAEGAELSWRSGVVLAGTVIVSPRSGSLYQGERAELVEELVSRLRQATAASGGTLLHYSGGEWVALFGASSAAETEDAIEAGLAIRTALLALEADPTLDRPVRVHLRMGADSGRLLWQAGPGAPILIDGDPLQRARRLAAYAGPSELHVSERLLRRSAALYETRTDASGARVVERRIRRALPPTALVPHVGRDLELAVLLRAFDSAVEGQAVVSAIQGGPGMGKSRLVAELFTRLADDPARPATLETARCSPRRLGSPYEPFTAVVAARIAGDEPGGAADRLSALLGELGCDDGAQRLVARTICRLLGLDRDAGGDGSLEPRQQTPDKAQAYDAVADLFRRLARRRPLVLHIDDFHHAQDATVELLSHVLSALRDEPVLVLLGTLPEQADARLVALPVALSRIVNVRLQPLRPPEAAALLRHAIEGEEVPEPVVQAAAEVGGGVPVHLVELADALHERGPATEGDLAGIDLDAVALQRAEQLTPIERAMLDRAAVAGMVAWRGLLAEGLDAGEREWERLRELRFLHEQRRSRIADQRQTAFLHPRLREVLYRHLRPSWRREEHRRVAQWLAARLDTASEPLEELAAWHFGKAGDGVAAGAMCLRAAYRSMRSHAVAEATELFERALRSFRTASRAAEGVAGLQEAYLGAALACCWTSRTVDAVAWLDRGAADADALRRDAEVFLARVAIRRAEVEELLGRFDAALDHLRTVEARLGDGRAPAVRLGAVARQAMVLARSGRIGEAEALARGALASVPGEAPAGSADEDRAAWDRALGTLHAALGHALCRQGRYDAGEQAYERSEEHWRRTGHPAGRAAARMNLGVAAFWKGQLERARTLWLEVAALYEQMGSPHGIASVQVNLAELALREGDPRRALGHLDVADASVRLVRAADVQLEARRLRAEALLAGGEAHAAVAVARDAVALARGGENAIHLGNALRALARCLTEQGAAAEAAACLAEARDALRRAGQEP